MLTRAQEPQKTFSKVKAFGIWFFIKWFLNLIVARTLVREYLNARTEVRATTQRNNSFLTFPTPDVNDVWNIMHRIGTFSTFRALFKSYLLSAAMSCQLQATSSWLTAHSSKLFFLIPVNRFQPLWKINTSVFWFFAS